MDHTVVSVAPYAERGTQASDRSDVARQLEGSNVRNGTAIGLVVLLLVILGAMAVQLAQAR